MTNQRIGLFSPGQLAPLLENEVPVIAATVLSRLPPNVSAETLGKFPPNLKTEILKHIACKSEVFPDVLERVAAVLREKAGAKATDALIVPNLIPGRS